MNELNDKDKYPKGHFVSMWTGIGIAIFSGLGIPLSIITDNTGLIGVGPAIGIVIGAVIGQIVEQKHEKEGHMRPLTEEERKRKQKVLKAGIIFLVLGILAFLFVLLYLR